MDPTPEPEQPPKPRRRRKKAPDEPELKVVGRDFGSRLRTQPIEGTDLSVHEETVNDQDALVDDDKDAELDDREFTVRAVSRQLVADPAQGVDEVRAWTDDQLLGAARAMLSFPPLTVRVNGVEQPVDPDEVVAIPDPLTFASFREAITVGPKRIYSSIEKTAQRIMELGVPKIASGLDSGILAAIRANESGIGSILDRSREVGASLEAFRTSPTFTTDALANLKGLSDTVGIAKSLTDLTATTRMAEKLARPIDFSTHAPVVHESLRMPAITPYHPEVDAIDNLGERIGAMGENQAKADREQLDVLTALAERSRDQGVAIQGVITEVKGLRADARWPNRAVIAAAVLAVVALVVSIIAAIPTVKGLLGL